MLRLFLVLEEVRDVAVGHGRIGLEPDSLAVRCDRLVHLALRGQRVSDAEMSVRVFRRLAGRGPRLAECPIEGCGGFRASMVIEAAPIAAEVPRIGPAAGQVGENRQSLVAAAHLIEQMAQRMRRLGTKGPRSRVIAHGLVARDGAELGQRPRQLIIGPDIVRVAAHDRAQQGDSRFDRLETAQRRGEEHGARRREVGRRGVGCQGPQGGLAHCGVAFQDGAADLAPK